VIEGNSNHLYIRVDSLMNALMEYLKESKSAKNLEFKVFTLRNFQYRSIRLRLGEYEGRKASFIFSFSA
jgi:hypothetical protein